LFNARVTGRGGSATLTLQSRLVAAIRFTVEFGAFSLVLDWRGRWTLAAVNESFWVAAGTGVTET
jgi:hypothetical protein